METTEPPVQSAGAIVLTRSREELTRWMVEALAIEAPESYGARWSHRFLVHEEHSKLSICFYTIDGYQTHDENVAFEHAFFIADDFVSVLESRETPETYLILIDTGDSFALIDEEDEQTEADRHACDEALARFGIALPELRSLRRHIPTLGDELWSTNPA